MRVLLHIIYFIWYIRIWSIEDTITYKMGIKDRSVLEFVRVGENAKAKKTNESRRPK